MPRCHGPGGCCGHSSCLFFHPANGGYACVRFSFVRSGLSGVPAEKTEKTHIAAVSALCMGDFWACVLGTAPRWGDSSRPARHAASHAGSALRYSGGSAPGFGRARVLFVVWDICSGPLCLWHGACCCCAQKCGFGSPFDGSALCFWVCGHKHVAGCVYGAFVCLLGGGSLAGAVSQRGEKAEIPGAGSESGGVRRCFCRAVRRVSPGKLYAVPADDCIPEPDQGDGGGSGICPQRRHGKAPLPIPMGKLHWMQPAAFF